MGAAVVRGTAATAAGMCHAAPDGFAASPLKRASYDYRYATASPQCTLARAHWQVCDAKTHLIQQQGSASSPVAC